MKYIIVLLLPILCFSQKEVNYLELLGKPIASINMSINKELEIPISDYYKAKGSFQFLNIAHDSLQIITDKKGKILEFSFTLDKTFSQEFYNEFTKKFNFSKKDVSDSSWILDVFDFTANDHIIQDKDNKHKNCGAKGKQLSLNFVKEKYSISLSCSHDNLFKPPSIYVWIKKLIPIDPASFLNKNYDSIPKNDYVNIYESFWKKSNSYSIEDTPFYFLNKESHGLRLFTTKSNVITETSLSFLGEFNEKIFNILTSKYGKPRMYIYLGLYDIEAFKKIPEQNILFKKEQFEKGFVEINDYKYDPYFIYWYKDGIRINYTKKGKSTVKGYALDFEKTLESTPFK
ncbi:hypothetical protein [Aquimarina aggregata]|nr:hypothetical protein [Aquimarina aggregata]